MTVWRIEICQYLLLKLELYVKLMWDVKKGNFISITSWLTLTALKNLIKLRNVLF